MSLYAEAREKKDITGMSEWLTTALAYLTTTATRMAVEAREEFASRLKDSQVNKKLVDDGSVPSLLIRVSTVDELLAQLREEDKS